MAETVKEFIVELGVDPDTRALQKFDQGLNKVKGNLKALVKIGAAAAGAVAGIGAAMFKAASHTAEYGDTVAKTSQVLGMTTEGFQELRHAAELAAVDLGTLETGVRRASRNFKDFANGEGEAAEAIEDLGVRATDAQGNLRPMIELMEESAGAFADMENETRKVALANEIFGRSGAKLLPLFNQGVSGFRDMREEAHELGIVLEDDAVEASALWQDQLLRVKRATESFVFEIGSRLIPLVNEAAEAYQQWVKQNRDLIESRINEFMDDLVPKLRQWAGTTLDVVQAVDDAAQKMGGWAEVLDTVGKAFAGLLTAFAASKVIGIAQGLAMMASNIGPIVSGLTALWGQLQIILAVGVGPWLSGLASAAASAAGPVAAAAAVLGVLAVAVQDIWTYFQGGDSLTGDFVEWFQSVESNQELIDQLSAGLEDLMDIGRKVGDLLVAIWPFVKVAIQNAWDQYKFTFLTLWRFTRPVLGLLVAGVRTAFGLIKAALQLLTGDFEGAWESVKEVVFIQLNAVWDFFDGMMEAMRKTLFGFIDQVQRIGGRVASLLGFDTEASVTASRSETVNVQGEAQGRGAAAARVRNERNFQAVLNNSGKTEINVNPPEGTNEERVAELVAEKQRELEQKQARQVRDELARGGQQ